jgi:imidazolonepropionase-like amidohydrolase
MFWGCLYLNSDSPSLQTVYDQFSLLTSKSYCMKKLGFLLLLSSLSGTMTEAQTAVQPPDKFLLINNVRIFNGSDEKTMVGNVLITNNLISIISSSPIPTNWSANTRIIDARGKFLMPGLIDVHYHAMFAAIPLLVALTTDVDYLNLVAAKNAKNVLMMGFTSIRDMGGPTFGLKRAIDDGTTIGPRIWPSGAFISQTGGHGDFRFPSDIQAAANAAPTFTERINAAAIADGVDAVLKRSREQLMLGASQLKLMAGGGVASSYDPIDVTQYTEPEFHAAVEAAENWGTYVTVHAYTPRAIQMAIRAGVKCIEHGQLADDASARMMAEKGIWWSLQPFLDDEFAGSLSPESRKKFLEMVRGTDTAYALAKKYKIKTAWGSDILFDARLAGMQGVNLTKLLRWYTPFQTLKMATSDNAELLALSGPRNPYPGKLGVIEEGALADLLLVDGDLLSNIKLIEDPEKNLLLIIKDGVIYKDILTK